MKSTHKIYVVEPEMSCTQAASNTPQRSDSSSPTPSNHRILLAVCPVDAVPNGLFSLHVVPLLTYGGLPAAREGGANQSLHHVARNNQSPELWDWKIEAVLEQFTPTTASKSAPSAEKFGLGMKGVTSVDPKLKPIEHCKLAIESRLRYPTVEYMSFSQNDHGCFVVAVLRDKDIAESDSRPGNVGANSIYGAPSLYYAMSSGRYLPAGRLGRAGCQILAFKINCASAPPSPSPGGKANTPSSTPLRHTPQRTPSSARHYNNDKPHQHNAAAPSELQYTFTLCADDTVLYWPDKLIRMPKAPPQLHSTSALPPVLSLPYPSLVMGTNLSYHVSAREPIITILFWVPGETVDSLRTSCAGPISKKCRLSTFPSVCVSIAVQFCQQQHLSKATATDSFMMGTVYGNASPKRTFGMVTNNATDKGFATTHLPHQTFLGPPSPSAGVHPSHGSPIIDEEEDDFIDERTFYNVKRRYAVSLLSDKTMRCGTSALLPKAWGRNHLLLAGFDDCSFMIQSLEPAEAETKILPQPEVPLSDDKQTDHDEVMGEGVPVAAAAIQAPEEKFRIFTCDTSAAIRMERREGITCCAFSGCHASSTTSGNAEHLAVVGTELGRIFVLKYSLSPPASEKKQPSEKKRASKKEKKVVASDVGDDTPFIVVVKVLSVSKHLLPMHVAAPISTIAIMPFYPTALARRSWSTATPFLPTDTSVITAVTVQGHVAMYRAARIRGEAEEEDDDTDKRHSGRSIKSKKTSSRHTSSHRHHKAADYDCSEGEGSPSPPDRGGDVAVTHMGVAPGKYRGIVLASPQRDVVVLNALSDQWLCSSVGGSGRGYDVAQPDPSSSVRTQLAARICPTLSSTLVVVSSTQCESSGYAKAKLILPLHKQVSKYRTVATTFVEGDTYGGGHTTLLGGNTTVGGQSNDPYVRMHFDPTYAVGKPLPPCSPLLKKICADENCERVPSITLVSRYLVEGEALEKAPIPGESEGQIDQQKLPRGRNALLYTAGGSRKAVTWRDPGKEGSARPVERQLFGQVSAASTLDYTTLRIGGEPVMTKTADGHDYDAAKALCDTPSDPYFLHIKVLGSGTYGTVTLAQSRNRVEEFFAIKRVPKGAQTASPHRQAQSYTDVDGPNALDEGLVLTRNRGGAAGLVGTSESNRYGLPNDMEMSSIRVFFQEAVTVMTSIPPHRNIVRYFGIYQSQQFHNIVMEVAEGGSLDAILFPPYEGAQQGGTKGTAGLAAAALLRQRQRRRKSSNVSNASGHSAGGKPAGGQGVTADEKDHDSGPTHSDCSDGATSEDEGFGHPSRDMAHPPSCDPYGDPDSEWTNDENDEEAGVGDAIDGVDRFTGVGISKPKAVLPAATSTKAAAPSRALSALHERIANSNVTHVTNGATDASRHADNPLVPHLPEHLLTCWLHQSLLGLHHLHQHGVMHRDVKAGNMLLSSPSTARDQRIMWTDFGVSTVVDGMGGAGRGATMLGGEGRTHLAQGGHTAHRTVIGTMGFTAPEMLLHWGCETAKYSVSCDLWSLGVVFYCYITGRGWLPQGGCIGVACSDPEIVDVCNGQLPQLMALKAAILCEGISSSDDDEGDKEHFGDGEEEFSPRRHCDADTSSCDDTTDLTDSSDGAEESSPTITTTNGSFRRRSSSITGKAYSGLVGDVRRLSAKFSSARSDRTAIDRRKYAASLSKTISSPDCRFSHHQQAKRAACFSDAFLSLIDSLMVVDYRSRPSARAALHSRLFVSPLERPRFSAFESKNRSLALCNSGEAHDGFGRDPVAGHFSRLSLDHSTKQVRILPGNLPLLKAVVGEYKSSLKSTAASKKSNASPPPQIPLTSRSISHYQDRLQKDPTAALLTYVTRTRHSEVAAGRCESSARANNTEEANRRTGLASESEGDRCLVEVVCGVSGCGYTTVANEMLELLWAELQVDEEWEESAGVSGKLSIGTATSVLTSSDDASGTLHSVDEEHLPPTPKIIFVSDSAAVKPQRPCELTPLLPTPLRRGWSDYCHHHFWRDWLIPHRQRRVQQCGVAEVRFVFSMPKYSTALGSYLTGSHMHGTPSLMNTMVSTRSGGDNFAYSSSSPKLPVGPIAQGFLLWLALIRAATASSGPSAFENEAANIAYFQQAVIACILEKLRTFHQKMTKAIEKVTEPKKATTDHNNPMPSEVGAVPKVGLTSQATSIPHGAVRPDNVFIVFPPASYAPDQICHLKLRGLLTAAARTLVLGPRDPFAQRVEAQNQYCSAVASAATTVWNSQALISGLHVAEKSSSPRSKDKARSLAAPSPFTSPDLAHTAKMCFDLGFIFDNSADRETIDEEVWRLAAIS